jgi:hypothetical protein
MAEVEDELGVCGEGDGDFAREILRGIKGDKAVDTDIVITDSASEAGGVECEGLASEPFDAVGKETEGDREVAAHSSEAFAGREAREDIGQGERTLDIVGERESLG